MRKQSIKVIICLAVFVLLFPAISIAGQYKVIRVVDGDTIVVDYNGKYEKVRFLCVNTPESVHKDQKQNIPMGKVASNYTKHRLDGKYVDLEFEGKRRGYYGRLLAYIFVGDKNFNVELVRQGLSPYYTKYGLSQKYDRKFRQAERYARQNKLNMWGDPELTEKYLRLKSKWGQHGSSLVPAVPPIKTQLCAFIGNARSHKFHRPGCRWAKNISHANRVCFKSRQDAIDQGYTPCKVCRP